MYQGGFIRGSAGHLYLGCFGALHDRHAWLYLPPFAEEMNLSRAVVSRQARRLAARGEVVVCLDYYGTGDSEGNLDQARLGGWLADLDLTVEWMLHQGAKTVSLWGLRFGGLLALYYLANRPAIEIERVLLWKPVLSGRQMMGQFFRLKQVNESLQGGDKVNWVERVKAGDTVEVAGYPITPSLFAELSELAIPQPLPANLPESQWIEIAAQTISPAVEAAAQGVIPVRCCDGAPFWLNPDIYDAPELIALSLAQAEVLANVC